MTGVNRSAVRLAVDAHSRALLYDLLTANGWRVCDAHSAERPSLFIIDVERFRMLGELEQNAWFPATAQCPEGQRVDIPVSVLVCRNADYPNVPHDRFDAVVTTPLSVPRFAALLRALVPHTGPASPVSESRRHGGT